ncbi:MAG: hypothetical protein ACKV19_16495 [Verrucomicrobiales bacterium]
MIPSLFRLGLHSHPLLHSPWRANTLATALALGAGVVPAAATAQVSLTSAIFPFEIGHERAYATHANATADVAGLVGPEGGPQVWDFTSGPADNVYRYSNFAPADSPSPGGFPSAQIAEKLTIAADGKTAFTYYAKSARGRELLGFHDGIANPEFPLVIFRSPLRDFPQNIEFGAVWTDTTTFPTQQSLLGSVYDLEVTLHIESKVDAYGTLRLPGLGDMEVLRVNELDRQETLLETAAGSIVLSDIYVRVIYWISREYGIVAQISSDASEFILETDSLVTASRFLRLSEFNNPSPSFAATIMPVDGSSVRLNWNPLPGVTRYTVESTTTLAADGWQLWKSVDGTSIDAPIDAPFRSFRVKPAPR